MPYYIGDVVKDHKLLIARTPEKFKSAGIEIRLSTEVHSIDYPQHYVECSGNERIPFDILVLALGAEAVVPGIEGIRKPGVFFLRNLEDAIAIKGWLREKKIEKVVILGAGFIGLEMAEALKMAGIQVTILHKAKWPANRWDEELSSFMHEILVARGVEFVPEVEVKEIDDGERGLLVKTDKGNWEAGLVLVATGVRPDVRLARSVGAALGRSGAIAVNFNQKTSLDDVYAVGDCAEVFHRVSKKWVNFPLGDIANKQGRVAGRNIGGRPMVFEGVVGAQSFRLFELECAATGLSEKEAVDAGYNPVSTIIWGSATAPSMGRKRLGLKLIADKSTGRILGAQAVGLEGAVSRINVLSVALFAEMNLDQIGYLDLAYAPPFGPAWDIVHVAAQTLKRMI
ncbi:MAG: FAD-dependent oxidoreductase [Syntrophales bacterium]|nr:FAD-dependent oxidoreductase [Syntrophales bacterium]